MRATFWLIFVLLAPVTAPHAQVSSDASGSASEEQSKERVSGRFEKESSFEGTSTNAGRATSDAEVRREIADGDPTESCLASVRDDPRFARLRNKLRLDIVDQVPFAMMASEALPTPNEHKLIGQWAEALDSCFASGQGYRESHYPAQEVTLAGYHVSQVRAVLLKLYRGRVSYGSANEQLAAAFEEFATRLKVIQEQIAHEKFEAEQQEWEAEDRAAEERYQRALLESSRIRSAREREIAEQQQRELAEQQQAASERARRAAAIAEIFKNTQQLPPPPVIRSPIITNCQQMGGVTNCVTQ